MDSASITSRVLYATAAAAMIASAGGLVTSVDGIVSAGKAIKETTAYQAKQNWKYTKSKVSDAKENLTYHSAYTTFVPVSTGKSFVLIPIYHPAVYPSPSNAKGNLDSAIAAAGRYNDDNEDVAGKIAAVKSALPNGTKVQKLDGKSVDSKTFGAERNALSAARDSIERKIEYYDGKIPAEYKSAKANAYYGTAGSAVGIGAAVGLAVAGKKKSIDSLRNHYVPIDSN